MDLRLVPTSRARVKRLISRDPSPLQLQQKRRDESCFAIKEMLSQRPNTDTRQILNAAVNELRKPHEEKKSRGKSHVTTLFVEIQSSLLSRLHVTSQFLSVTIDDGDFWMERFGGDIWGVFEQTQARDEHESHDISHDLSRDMDTEDTQEDAPPPSGDVSPHKLLGRDHVTSSSHVTNSTSRDSHSSHNDLLSRAPVATIAKNPNSTFTSLIASLPPPQRTHKAYIPLNLTKPVTAIPLPSVSVSELLLSSYRSQLYCCKTSLIYFAKAMSKSRALCKSTLEKHTQNKSRVFSASQMRKMSYKLYSRELAKLVQPLSEWSQVYEYSEFCKMMTNTKDEHVIQWKDALSYTVLSDPEKLAVEISLLKFREMQLQSIVLLELLAVAPVTKSKDDAESAKQQELEQQKKKEARKMGLYKSRKGKSKEDTDSGDQSDYKTLLTQLFSSMCIWQQLSDSGTDHVQEFCKSVVIPYFSSRVPHVVEDLLKRAGLEKEERAVRAVKVSREESVGARDSTNSMSRDSTPRAPSPSLSLSRDSDNTLHSDVSSSSGVSRASHVTRASRTASGKPQVRGGLLTSSRSFDSRSQIGMRFKGGSKDKDKEKEKDKEMEVKSHVTTSMTAAEPTGMFRKSRDVNTATTRPTVHSQVAATPVKRTRPVLTSFTAEPDNPFINDSHVIDDSPFAKRMRGESTGPRRRLGLGDGTSVVFDSARRRQGGGGLVSHDMSRDVGGGSGSRDVDGVEDSPVQRSRYSVVMDSPTKVRSTPGGQVTGHVAGSGGSHVTEHLGGQLSGSHVAGHAPTLFSGQPKKLFSASRQTTIRPSIAAPVAPVTVSATPKRRTQPVLTNEQYPREDNPFYQGTDDAVMDTSPTRRG